MKTRRLAAGACALILALSACGSDSPEDKPLPDAETTSAAPAPTEEAPEAPEPDAAPATQEKTCDWDSGRVKAKATAPKGKDGDLATAIIGAWQHTHIDSGSGYEPVKEADIRYVFPSAKEMLYCQDVPGVTDQAQQEAKIKLSGSTIQPPAPHKGFKVVAWDENTMVWNNNLDNSKYLLVRR